MKAKKIWVATNPEDETEREVCFSEPEGSYYYFNTRYHETLSAEWIECVCIPVED